MAILCEAALPLEMSIHTDLPPRGTLVVKHWQVVFALKKKFCKPKLLHFSRQKEMGELLDTTGIGMLEMFEISSVGLA